MILKVIRGDIHSTLAFDTRQSQSKHIMGMGSLDLSETPAVGSVSKLRDCVIDTGRVHHPGVIWTKRTFGVATNCQHICGMFLKSGT